MNPYITGLVLLLSLAALISLLLCRKKPVEPGVKLMLFVLYFWGIAFIETGLFALGYFLFYR
ncbi:hypothetical protein [methane-oxidizing endosymbiont of Gigantopelta aegis]|uniref:hypothetical protein n=1 Tax=methane-oxidizing endosymbiont of Gigantopelta aegis TaxID=2794938 RepID=UPI0018DDD876|nr:hypothetical protein [methane-oxidizing endosymbiont of Gigantopelta aegis]